METCCTVLHTTMDCWLRGYYTHKGEILSTIIHTFFRKSLLNTEHHRGGRSHPPMFHKFESACWFCFGKRNLLGTGMPYNASRAFLRDFSAVDAVSPYAQENAINASKTQQQGVSWMRTGDGLTSLRPVPLASRAGSHQHHCRDYSTIPTLEHQCFEGVGPSKEKSPLAAVPQVSLIKL